MKASWTQKPAIWDGKHIDNPPGPTQMGLRMPYVAGHDVIGFVSCTWVFKLKNVF